MKKNLFQKVLCIILCISTCHYLSSQNIYDFNSIVDAAQNGQLKIPSTHNFQYLLQQGEFGTPGNFDFTAYVPISNSSNNGYLSINHENFNPNGGVTVFDINQNSNKQWTLSNTKAIQYGQIQRACSGHVTSWGAVLSAEEVSNGRVLETDPSTGTSIWRHQLGLLAHENVVENKNNNRTFYTGEDTVNGVVLKFVADNPSDLSSGSLYALDLDPGNTTGVWRSIPNDLNTDTHVEAVNVGASTFSGVEDIEINPIDNMVYFAVKGTGTIYRFTENNPLGGGTISNFEEYVTNTTYNTGNGTAQFGIGVDNLAFDNEGNLWALQDGGDNQIWVIENGHSMANPMVKLFGQVPFGAEPTGITFTPDFKYLFMSVMHPSGNNSANQADVFGNTVSNNSDFAIAISRNENWLPVSTLDLNNFDSNCTIGNINSANETSGITYSGNTNTLFVVSDNLNIHELDLGGNLIRTISLSNFNDTEGIVWLGGNQFAITEEKQREIVVVNIFANTTNINYPGPSGLIQITDPGDGDNFGFEGLAYDVANDILYIGKEGDQDDNNIGIEPLIYKIGNPLSQVGNTISNPIESFTNYPVCPNFDISGLAMSPTGSLLMITEQCNIVYELDPNDGTILSQGSVPQFTNPEGITIINDNEIWVVGENNQLRQFVIVGSTCDDGDPNTTNDIFDSNCGCSGTPADCPIAGQSCNDGDPCTINDVYDNTPDCNCLGTFSGDVDGDGVCAAEDPDDSDPCVPINCGGCTLLDYESFENGFGLWNDGGGDCARGTGGAPSDGSYSVQIRDNSGAASSMFSDNLNLSGYNDVEISFHFYPNSMETNENFFLEYSTNGGNSWAIFESYVSGIDFVNNNSYNFTELITGINWTSTSRFRFRCDASSNGDQIYLDEVEISGCSPITGAIVSEQETAILEVENRQTRAFDVYPNPAIESIFIDLGQQHESNARIVIQNLDGKTVKDLSYDSIEQSLIEISTASFVNGLYQIAIIIDNDIVYRTKIFVAK